MTVSIITPTRATLLTHLAAASEVDADGKATRWTTAPDLCAVCGGDIQGRAMRNRLRDAVNAGQVRRLLPHADGRVRYVITDAGRAALQRQASAATAKADGLRRHSADKPRRTAINPAAATPRDTGKSSQRKRIEDLLKRHDDSEGLTSRQIAAATKIPLKVARHTIGTAQTYATIYNISDNHIARYVHRDTWLRIKAEKPQRVAPMRNSNQPLGSVDYWRKHLAWQNTPARVELLA
jgi:hypothetical protein